MVKIFKIRIFLIFLILISILKSDFLSFLLISAIFLFSLTFSLREEIFIKNDKEAEYFEYFGVFVGTLFGFFHIFNIFPDSDLLVHFLGGIFISYWGYLVVKETKNPLIFKIIFILFCSLSFGVLWEFAEFFWDLLIASKLSLPLAQQDNFDTMTDLLADFLGGISLIFIKIKEIKALNKNLSGHK